MIATIGFLGLICAIVAAAILGSGRRQRQADTIADLQQAEKTHDTAAASRAVPLADPDRVLAAHGRLRD